MQTPTPVSSGTIDQPLDFHGAQSVPTIHVISDSLGDTAADVALAAAAQFDAGIVHIERLPKASSLRQISEYLDAHLAQDGPEHFLVFHTIANRELRTALEAELVRRKVPHIDVLGPALDAIAQLTGEQPHGQAGVIRRTDERYFRRIEAMEFFVSHDDGRNPQDLTKADIVLVGVSRTSKTPLSMYLSFHGYKVANIPLAKGSEPPHELFDVEPFRVFGLMSTPEVLSTIRNERLGSDRVREVAGAYADPCAIADELDEARALMRRLGCIVIHTDGRAVEETAQVILGYFDRAEALWEARRRTQQD
ncbi:MAG: kinase/pyrophosphorylase [Coriobacteriia bacterium]|nr:kinase/pyrophosphorylase [Coriobacteriia bacterium]